MYQRNRWLPILAFVLLLGILLQLDLLVALSTALLVVLGRGYLVAKTCTGWCDIPAQVSLPAWIS